MNSVNCGEHVTLGCDVTIQDSFQKISNHDANSMLTWTLIIFYLIIVNSNSRHNSVDGYFYYLIISPWFA